jgi:hypothetical protein
MMPHALDLQRLPIVVAVTGHRDLRPDDEPILANAVDAIFAELQQKYPSTPLLLLTPLAEGADQLAAEVAARRSIPYRVPIPMPLEKYREDFAAPERLARFDELLCAADGPPYEMPFFESNDAANIGDERRRSHQYAVLAAHLGRAAHVLIALWDGVPSQTVGGTAQAVRFRVLGVPSRYRQQSCIEAPETGPVYHVYTTRSANVTPAHPTGYRSLRVRRARGGEGPRLPASLAEQFAEIDELPAQTPDPFQTLYARIEAFNQDCARVPRPDPGDGESAAGSLMPVAERVATYYQRKYVRALQLIFFATATAVLTFLLYADVVPRAHPIVLVYLAASGVALLTYLTARRERWQDRAQDYRALEIGLHVQQAWDAAGLGQSVADFYIRRQHSELDWIRDAIRTAHAVDRHQTLDEPHAVRTVRDFVLRQYAYFAGTGADRRIAEYARSSRFPGGAKREHRKAHLHHRLNQIALRVSFTFSIVLISYGLVAWLAPERVESLPDEVRWHGYLMFCIGISVAAAALFHEYSVRRAHAQQGRRYEVMAQIYRRALDALDEAEQRSAWREATDGPLRSPLETARACILELGHEALSENTDWLLLHRELPIQLISVH